VNCAKAAALCRILRSSMGFPLSLRTMSADWEECMLCMLSAVVDGGMDSGRGKKEDVIRKKEDNLDQR
jgi:hypothetical protein